MSDDDPGRSGFYCIPNDVLDKYGAKLGPIAMMTLNAIVRYTNKDRQAWPSLQTIADLIGVSRRSAAIAIDKLIDAGLLTKDARRKENGAPNSNIYTLTPIACGAIGIAGDATPVWQEVHGGIAGDAHKQDTKNKTQEEQDTGNKFDPADAGRTDSPQQQYFQKICDIVGWDWHTLSKADRGRIAQTMGILQKADYTLDDLNRFGREVWAHDWRWQKQGQHPTLNQLRQEIGKLRSVEKMPDRVNGNYAQTNSDYSAYSVDSVVAMFKQQEVANEQY